MKLRDARICVGCDELFVPEYKTDVNGKKISLDFTCPSCGCTATFPIWQWIPTMSSHARTREVSHG